MLASAAYNSLVASLQGYYEPVEANAIAHLVLEKLTTQRDKSVYLNISLSNEQLNKLSNYATDLLNKVPVQYVLEEAWFYDLPFFVNNQVLIPRPETEELVQWVLKSVSSSTPLIIIDIGTGSGCIPVTLKKHLPQATIHAVDKSSNALSVAQQNAAAHQVKIHFMQLDFLDQSTWNQLPLADIIISNPPYIKQGEAGGIAMHVKNFEPSVALFVPDNDPLIFYKKIAAFAKTHLKQNGNIFVETNQLLGKETAGIFEDSGFSCVLRKDINSNERMIKASNE